MPKHKPKRSAPSIDMTAMCDVAFLLLTFFMLTAKAKPQETVIVDTPTSISETKLPDAGTLTILVDKTGKVCSIWPDNIPDGPDQYHEFYLSDGTE